MLHPKTLRLVRAGSYAALATVTPEGALSCHMMWVGCDDDFLYVNTEVERYKFGNMQVGDPVALMIFESSRSWVEVRGTVVGHIYGDAALAQLDELSMIYNHRPYGKRIDSPRVICRIRPDREFVYLPSTSRASDESATGSAAS
ncbi:Pyridoxamine 5'-phosphate oxidase [Micromonospora purpureochromogenes]|uniref:Pyridoxamine 5'-phosphate oxidase n=1 Tax=Micromonospora purpureochromogenes TaxID=47872 RepID=A0A1C4Z8Q1_9ACTN|nr:pyridoxamine 5'-phosphate oxidase family protein [Micromonospora purpureochromogenes]SCF29392.1 Pyridoxamine 5'-phosphate oxidase [Micromonospora purpureochromogenes]